MFGRSVEKVPSREESPAQLRLVIEDLRQFTMAPLGSDIIDERQAIGKIFAIHSVNKRIINHFSVSQDPELLEICSKYRELMSVATQRIEEIKQHNLELLTNIPQKMLALIKADHHLGLRKLIKQADGVPGMIDHIDYALRVAAQGGKIDCLNVVLETRVANLTAAGPTSGKIALHHAIGQGHLVCIEALLNAVNIHDLYDRAAQLLFGDAPERPIDHIAKIKDPAKQAAITAIIRYALDGRVGFNTLPVQRAEIERTLRKLEEDVASSAASSRMSVS
jgi:hypothetical protein